jgi:isopentenyldiphosphate isomerase
LHPNCWDTRFGGHVANGQSVEDAAIKELEEEIGIKRKIEELRADSFTSYDGKNNREHNYIFYCDFKDTDKPIFNDSEVVEVKWMYPEEIITSIKNHQDTWIGSAAAIQKIMEDYKK